VSLVATDDASCAWCRLVMTTTSSSYSRRRFCSKRCRQSAFRLRRRSASVAPAGTTGTFLYADPPYPGTSRKYYRDEPTFAGEVDFPALIASLEASRDAGALGWALSTSAKSLRDLLPLCPPQARVCAWVKPHGISPRTYGLHNAWEPVIVVGGRARRPGKRDWLRAMPARGEGTLPGRKPIAFCAWLFELLGMEPGDTLVDLFPGTGIVARAWAEVSSGAAATSSRSSATLPESATVVEVLSDGPSSGSAATLLESATHLVSVTVVDCRQSATVVAPRGTTAGGVQADRRLAVAAGSRDTGVARRRARQRIPPRRRGVSR
jgi:hypothetical protein